MEPNQPVKNEVENEAGGIPPSESISQMPETPSPSDEASKILAECMPSPMDVDEEYAVPPHPLSSRLGRYELIEELGKRRRRPPNRQAWAAPP